MTDSSNNSDQEKNESTAEKILSCTFEGCTRVYQTLQGLKSHIRAAHTEKAEKPQRTDQKREPSGRSDRSRRSSASGQHGATAGNTEHESAEELKGRKKNEVNGDSSSHSRSKKKGTTGRASRKRGRVDDEVIEVEAKLEDTAAHHPEPESKRRRVNGILSSAASSTNHANRQEPRGSESPRLQRSRTNSVRTAIDAAREKALAKRRQEIEDQPKTAFLREWKKKHPGICCLCNKEGEEGDELVICQGVDCAVVVHQECYGIVNLDPRQAERWRCDRCAYFDISLATCVMCPYRDGAFRRVKGTDQWVHLTCALWVDEVDFGNHETMSDIDLSRVDPKRWSSTCSICTDERDAAYGVKLDCHVYQCRQSVHAMCAHIWDLLEDADEDSSAEEEQENPFYVYCKKHGPRGDEPQMTSWAKWVALKHRTLAQMEASTPQHGASHSDLRAVFEDAMSTKTVRDADTFRKLQHDLCRLTAEQTFQEYQIPRLEEDLDSTTTEVLGCIDEIDRIRKEMKNLETNLVAIAPALGIEMSRVSHHHHQHHDKKHHHAGIVDAFVKAGDDVDIETQYQQVFATVYGTHQSGPEDEGVVMHHKDKETTTKKKSSRRVSAKHTSTVTTAINGTSICDNCKGVEAPPAAQMAFHGVFQTNSPAKSTKVIPGSPSEFVQCSHCRKLWHIGCLDPPLARPPARGYAWLCEICDGELAPTDDDSECASVHVQTGQEGSDTDGSARRRRRTLPPVRYT